MAQELYIATNNGDMGGGEVMLLNIARAARSLGYRVTVIGPAHPPQLAEAAADEGEVADAVVVGESLLLARRTRRSWLRLPPMRGLPVWYFPPVPAPST